MESGGIVISSDAIERGCNWCLSAHANCCNNMQTFWTFFLRCILLQLSDKNTSSEEGPLCRAQGSNPEAGCRESTYQKMSMFSPSA